MSPARLNRQTSRITTIAVTGATGTIGSAVINLLLADPSVAIRAGSRRPAAMPANLRASQIRPVAFDWDATAGLDDLVAGAETMLVLPPPARHPLPTTTRLLDAASAAGVGHVVFLSTLGAEFEPGFAFGRWALAGEKTVAAAGIPYTVLRPNSFMTNFFTTIRPGPDGALRVPWGSASISYVDPHDVAAVAARVLTAPQDHRGFTYQLTGPAALDTYAVAAALTEAGGAPIQYVDVPMDRFRAALSDSGMPEPMVSAFLELHAVMASGARASITADVQQVAGRPPRSFATFAANHAKARSRPQRSTTTPGHHG